jgi:hypothetical protein
MELFLRGDSKGRQTRNGEMYHLEFKNHFWKKPSKYYFSNFVV